MTGWWAASYVALWFLVIVLCVVVVALARQIGTLYLRLGPRGALEMDDEGPALGEPAPVVELPTLGGGSVRLGEGGQAQMLLFVSPGCHICEQVLPSVDAVARVGQMRPLVITDVDAEETALVFKSKRVDADVVPGLPAAQAYQVPGTPYVVLIDGDGVVKAKGTVNNLEQMEGLVDTFNSRRETDRRAS